MEMALVVISCFALIASVIAIIVGIVQFKRQLKLSFFEKYTSRYMHIMEILPESFWTNTPLSTLDEENAIHAIRLYIDLCSEEYYLYKNHHLNEKVWKEWKSGMKQMFEHPIVKDVFDQKHVKTYQEFVKFVENELKANISN